MLKSKDNSYNMISARVVCQLEKLNEMPLRLLIVDYSISENKRD